ncbi:aldo/keto reductase [Aquincola sp. MAHUQ-54]|uniref:Aldo/keto reductase n=1 Tax=Aquincola agrisoli TaxID=3119538 RepID=A0AAW9PX42_9BURK
MHDDDRTTRRRWLQLLAAGAACAGAPGRAATAPLITRAARPGGPTLPLVGLGTWITFNVGDDAAERARCAEVMKAFFDAGGRLVDSSPMYGSSQAVVGEGLRRLGMPKALYSADKVWTGSGARGPAQIEASRRLWGIPRFDLLQVHNLLAWEAHLATLFAMKAEGRLRHVGITTSEGRRHDEIEQIMRSQPLDFVQISYSLRDRRVEERILPLARERGIAVIANRPFEQGALTQALQRHPLPGWAAELGCTSWAQAALKFVISHPAVTCAIPATTRVDHVLENLGTARGPLPDEAMRRRIAADAGKLA